MFYLAVGPRCWGRGKTEKEAIKRARENFRGGKWKCVVYSSTDPEVYVDDFGTVWTTEPHEPAKLVRKIGFSI